MECIVYRGRHINGKEKKILFLTFAGDGRCNWGIPLAVASLILGTGYFPTFILCFFSVWACWLP